MSPPPSSRIHRILRQHVLTDRLLGVRTLPLGEVEPPQAPATPASPQPTAQRQTAAVAPVSPPARPRSDPFTQEALYQPAPARPRPTGELLDGRSMARDQKLAILQAMDEGEVRSCSLCVLCQRRRQTVFGEGDPMTPLMFIGEGPGEQEDRTGRPFVGPAGQLLDKMIVAMGLSREAVYIANAVKCRPPNNRTPTFEETDTCGRYLARQIAIIRPKAIVTLGGPATKHILDTQMGITALRGRWQAYHGLGEGQSIPVMPTFHPAYLLRAYTVDNRKKVWSDLQAVMDRIKADA